ncbi:peptidoglycan/xylan/chitin deacetylase (PgdA/CDA1 family) [Amycolatopsis endophytica]|uniref:Peptidoglycan/xylan/chitin deacetylase (PgdA/CDA1 family) n=1 Tax=Amycolatopsis endophytica TaxID=860233 RepID=A0A853B3X3_9PSEU|nr:polysaccharide deacetylase family protein [Amycolatopsis endophytica]NYI89504.1 peptidoglycan/xylan/chitin deacetylase (PgdA/CDA1 family) [Amycolatopsis endophytica]
MTPKLVSLVAVLFLVTGCTTVVNGQAHEPGDDGQEWAAFAPLHEPAAAPAAPAPAAPAEVGANELGRVPVLMYHRIVAEPESVYDRTPEDFRAELERLDREGYFPVPAADFTAGRMDVPAGRHPVVITFDDGDPSQLTLGPDGKPVPGTAAAIMLDVARTHPGFRPTATFYVNADPFGEPGGTRTIPWLLANGFDVGNHTMTHANLRDSDEDTTRTEIADLDALIRRAAPAATPTTIALPFGIHPNPPELAIEGAGYHYQGAFLVGSNPSASPFTTDFDPLNIPRIRSQGPDGEEAEYGSTVWLDKLGQNRDSLYTSDGDAARISYPKSDEDEVVPEFRSRANPY